MPNRLLIFIGVVLGANLQVLDTTMATVALPRIQGTLSATIDEITWVLAAYLIAVAIVMPLVGTLTNWFGRRRVFLISVAGFGVASIFTGAANGLEEIVVCRFLQGVFASSLAPISQSFVFDAYPPEQRGKALGWWSLGVMVGMVLGPALGGYLTEHHSWRWAFYLNVPISIMAFIMIYIFGPTGKHHSGSHSFGATGFLFLSLGLVCIQLVLSRGEQMDWFASPQIRWTAAIALGSLYLFGIHSMYSSRPFIAKRVLSDRNFMLGVLCLFIMGAHWLSFLALISPYLQKMAGYPVFIAGLVMVPQAIGNAVGSVLSGQLVSRIGPRPLMSFGVILLAWANWNISLLNPEFEGSVIYGAVFAHGLGIGFMFVALSVSSFSTLPREYRDVGTGLYVGSRNLGSSVGVSLVIAYLVRETQANRHVLKDNISPFNDVFNHLEIIPLWNLTEKSGIFALELEAVRQASAIAYSDDFFWLTILSAFFLPLILLMRNPAKDVN